MDTAIQFRRFGYSRGGRSGPPWLLYTAHGLGLVLLLTFLLSLQPRSVDMHSGQVASTTVVAERQETYIDKVATAARRSQAASATAPVYRTDISMARLRVRQAQSFLQASQQSLPALPASQRLAQIQKLLPPGFPVGSLQEFSTLSPDDYRLVSQDSLALLKQAVAWRFDSNQLTSIQFSLLSSVPGRVTGPQRTAIGEVLTTFLAPTEVADPVATLEKQRMAARHVPAVTQTIYPGEVIVRRGDMVTPSIMEKLTALGLQHRQNSWQDVIASLLFAVAVVTMLFWYLHAFQPGIPAAPRLLLLVDASVLLSVLGARILADGHVLLPFFLPVAAVSTFAAVLIAPEACIAITVAMAILAGWAVANSFELTTYYFLTGSAGVLAIRHVQQIRQFIMTGAYISAFALLTMVTFGLVSHNYDLAAIQDYVLAASFNGFASSALALGGFALLSGFFGVTTTLQLLELGQPNQPLLNRLMVKAPGTYNHSLIVATMVERAADETGANALVAKLGALYHDVGKGLNPQCFVENQLGAGNIHDELRPEESARIIRGHVSQGLRLARQHKLPRVILDAIGEHHGTMSIAFFLHKAREEYGPNLVDSSVYGYPGPKPQSKETALLMLADGCESAVRAAADHSQNKIREIVDRIFAERIAQGQLDESPLTLGDLDRARFAFCSVLNGLYHPRIDYPEAAEPVYPRLVESDESA